MMKPFLVYGRRCTPSSQLNDTRRGSCSGFFHLIAAFFGDVKADATTEKREMSEIGGHASPV